MKNLSLKICLAIVMIFGSVGEGFALPKCPGSPITVRSASQISKWHLCEGIVTYDAYDYISKYSGEFKNNTRTGDGIMFTSRSNTPRIREGLWNDNQFKSKRKTRFSQNFNYPQKSVQTKPSHLRTAFTTLSKELRKQLQTNLKDLDLYKSSIDGLYGKGTSGALTAYNKEHLGGADLKKSANAEKLIDKVLALNKSEVAAPWTPIGRVTTVAEVEPEVEVTVAEPQVEISQTYQAGIEAYNSGDFKTAMEQVKLPSPLGDVDALFYLGKMYA